MHKAKRGKKNTHPPYKLLVYKPELLSSIANTSSIKSGQVEYLFNL
jgi:hypothetical protein